MEILIILIAIAIVCSIGFKKYIWFISIGYGLSIATIGFMLLILFNKILTIPLALSALVLICYGLRLGIFLALREFKSKTYNSKMKGEIVDSKDVNMGIKIAIWVSSVFLYFIMSSPIIFRFINNAKIDSLYYIGLIIATLGIILELTADAEKSRAKKINANRFCDKGLYKIVRCPNYLGELILWLGVLLSGITALNGVIEYIIAILGFISITYVMFSGARRLEIRQDKCYGNDEEYQKYKASVPIIIPFIPLYSVKKHKWLKA